MANGMRQRIAILLFLAARGYRPSSVFNERSIAAHCGARRAPWRQIDGNRRPQSAKSPALSPATLLTSDF
jgi:hypothetical protein